VRDDGVVFSVDPPSGYVDTSLSHHARAFESFTVTIEQADAVSKDIEFHFESDAGVHAREIVRSGNKWTVYLNQAIPGGAMIRVVVDPLGAAFSFASRPGDVNQDGRANPTDLEDLKRAVASGRFDVPYDVDGDGKLNDSDVAALDEFLRDTDGALRSQEYIADATPVSGLGCCCNVISQCISATVCPPGTTPVTCPCVDPCHIIGGP